MARFPDRTARSSAGSDGFSLRLCQPSTLRVVICPRSQQSPGQHRGCFCRWQDGLNFDPVQSLDCIRGPKRFPLALRHSGKGSGKGEELVASLFQEGGHCRAFQPPLSDEGFALRLDLLLRGGVDHTLVIRRYFLVQPVRRMGQKVAMPVNRAALDQNLRPRPGQCLLTAWSPIGDDELCVLKPRLRSPVSIRSNQLSKSFSSATSVGVFDRVISIGARTPIHNAEITPPSNSNNFCYGTD
jgi:hypothetical protein